MFRQLETRIAAQAVARSWAAFWRQAERDARSLGLGPKADHYARRARFAEKRAARIRRQVLGGMR